MWQHEYSAELYGMAGRMWPALRGGVGPTGVWFVMYGIHVECSRVVHSTHGRHIATALLAVARFPVQGNAMAGMRPKGTQGYSRMGTK
jgi:hypothetical protein